MRSDVRPILIEELPGAAFVVYSTERLAITAAHPGLLRGYSDPLARAVVNVSTAYAVLTSRSGIFLVTSTGEALADQFAQTPENDAVRQGAALINLRDCMLWLAPRTTPALLLVVDQQGTFTPLAASERRSVARLIDVHLLSHPDETVAALLWAREPGGIQGMLIAGKKHARMSYPLWSLGPLVCLNGRRSNTSIPLDQEIARLPAPGRAEVGEDLFPDYDSDPSII